MSASDVIRKRLDERGIEYETYDLPDGEHGVSWDDRNGIEWEVIQQGENFEIHALQLVTPEQAITATVGPTLDQDLQQALDFMRIWITDDAHLGESDISYELEKAEGLRNLEAIEQAIAATVGADYAITFAPTLDRPPETMVGETVYDAEGNAIGWIVNATVGVGTCRAVVCNQSDCVHNREYRCACTDLEIQDQECLTYRCRYIDYDEEEE